MATATRLDKPISSPGRPLRDRFNKQLSMRLPSARDELWHPGSFNWMVTGVIPVWCEWIAHRSLILWLGSALLCEINSTPCASFPHNRGNQLARVG